jgi:hypothetical protein
MQRGAITLKRTGEHAAPRITKKASLEIRLATFDAGGEREHRCNDALLFGYEATCFLMELNEVHRVVGDLLAIGSTELGALELDNRNHPIAKQHAVHPKAAPPKIKLEQHMTKCSQIRGGQRRFEQLDLAGALLKFTLKDADARAPLLMLILLDVQPFSRGTASEFANDDLNWVADEGFAIFNVPGGASAQEFLQCWKNQFTVCFQDNWCCFRSGACEWTG